MRLVLHVFGRMDRGGAELRTVDVLRNIDHNNVELAFCTLSAAPGQLDEEIRSLGGYVHPCKLDAFFARRFRRLLRDLRPDVVHSHVHYSSGYMLRLAAEENIPIRIAHFRSTGDGQRRNLKRAAQSAIMRYWIDRYATDILGVSQGALEFAWLRHKGSDTRCKVIYNGLDVSPYGGRADGVEIRREFGIPDDCRLYIHVGRFTPDKNHQKLLQIFSILAEIDACARLLLVGRTSPEERSAVDLATARHALRGKVLIAGERSDVPQLLAASDALIFPSLREGLPGAVLEAVAAGIPVVASNIPGILEVQRHFSSIRCLSPQDDDRIWAQAVSELVDTRRTGSSSRSRADLDFKNSPFSMERCISSLYDVWGVTTTK